MRTMIGLMPGPERPPNLLPIAGRKVFTSILRPRSVFETTSASAPAASAGLPVPGTSAESGESLRPIGVSAVARRRVAGAALARHRLCDQGAEPVEVDDLRKIGREAPRRGHDRVLERHAPDLHVHVYHPTASWRSNTGPSMHTRRSSFLPSTSN